MFQLSKWFFDQLSLYFKVEDTYKDAQNQGILERFMGIFGEDFDEVLLPLILDYVKIVDPIESRDFANNILDPSNADDGKYLNHIAYSLGNPLDLTGDDYYRKVLTFAITLNKIKGTIPSYKLWGAIIGLDISIIEVPSFEYQYDSGYTYDQLVDTEVSADPIIYDSECPTCGDYYLIIEGISEDDLDDETKDLLDKIICFNEPINANLREPIFRRSFEDEIFTCMEEEVEFTFTQGGFYDDTTSKYDDGLKTDLPVVISTQTITQTCSLGGNEFDAQEFDLDEFNI